MDNVPQAHIERFLGRTMEAGFFVESLHDMYQEESKDYVSLY